MARLTTICRGIEWGTQFQVLNPKNPRTSKLWWVMYQSCTTILHATKILNSHAAKFMKILAVAASAPSVDPSRDSRFTRHWQLDSDTKLMYVLYHRFRSSSTGTTTVLEDEFLGSRYRQGTLRSLRAKSAATWTIMDWSISWDHGLDFRRQNLGETGSTWESLINRMEPRIF